MLVHICCKQQSNLRTIDQVTARQQTVKSAHRRISSVLQKWPLPQLFHPLCHFWRAKFMDVIFYVPVEWGFCNLFWILQLDWNSIFTIFISIVIMALLISLWYFKSFFDFRFLVFHSSGITVWIFYLSFEIFGFWMSLSVLFCSFHSLV